MCETEQPGFYDLCVNLTEDIRELRGILTKLHKLGYGTVAVNVDYDESSLGAAKKKKAKKDEGEKSSLPPPTIVDNLAEEFRGRLNVLSRVTFSFSDTGKTHLFNYSPNLKKYNLYAVEPRSQSALLFACSQLNADLISIGPSVSGLKLNRKLYKQAVERGLYFEVRYADVLRPEGRRNAIHHSHLFHTYGKSKSVVVTSGARSINELRNPYDVINLCALLGLNEAESKGSLYNRCASLLLRAERRRRGKAVFSIEYLKEEDQENQPKRIKLDEQ